MGNPKKRRRTKVSKPQSQPDVIVNVTENKVNQPQQQDETRHYSSEIPKLINQLLNDKGHAYRDASLTQLIISLCANYNYFLAVELLCDHVSSFGDDLLRDNAVVWTTNVLKLVEADVGSCSEQALCYHTICQILLLSHQSNDLSKTLSLNCVSKVLNHCINIPKTAEDAQLIASINLMKICFKYYGGTCLPFKNPVESYLIGLLLERPYTCERLRQCCCDCFAYLPFSGGQGSAGTKHTDMWTNQMTRLLYAISKLITNLYTPCDVLHTVESKDPPTGQALPIVSHEDVNADSYKKAGLAIVTYVDIINSMLSVPGTCRVELPIKHLLTILCRGTSVSPDSVVFRKKSQELDGIRRALFGIHTRMTNCFSLLVSRLGTNLYMFKSTISSFIESQLKWIKNMKDDFHSDTVEVHLTVYRLLMALISEPGCHTIVKDISNVIVKDILSMIDVKQMIGSVAASSVGRHRGGPPRKKMKVSVSQQQQPSLDMSATNPVRSYARVTSLSLLCELLNFCSASLSSHAIRTVYQALINTALVMQSHRSSQPFNADMRLGIYKALMSTIQCYNHEIGPLTHIVVPVIRNGLTDPSPEVRRACQGYDLICQLATQPRAPPLDIHYSPFIGRNELVEDCVRHEDNVMSMNEQLHTKTTNDILESREDNSKEIKRPYANATQHELNETTIQSNLTCNDQSTYQPTDQSTYQPTGQSTSFVKAEPKVVDGADEYEGAEVGVKESEVMGLECVEDKMVVGKVTFRDSGNDEEEIDSDVSNNRLRSNNSDLCSNDVSHKPATSNGTKSLLDIDAASTNLPKLEQSSLSETVGATEVHTNDTKDEDDDVSRMLSTFVPGSPDH